MFGNANADVLANKHHQEIGKSWLFPYTTARVQCRSDGIYLMFDNGYKLTDYAFLKNADSQRFIKFIKPKYRKKKSYFSKDWELTPEAYKGIDALIEYGKQDC